MRDLKFFGSFLLFFGLVFIVSLVVGFFYQLIVNGSGVFDFGASMAFALIITLIYSFIRLFYPGVKTH